MFISIITPLYNRAHYLKKLANSINSQNKKWLSKIEWIIVDDGSTDDIDITIDEIKEITKLKYIKQNNGGKHTAINKGLEYCNGEYLIIVDSDDHLVENALDNLFNTLYGNNHEINAFIDTKSHGQYFDKEVYTLDDFIKLGGDRLIAVKSELLKSNKFPIYKDECFVTESVAWNKIIDKYNIHCFNLPVIAGEYMDGGLTSNYQQLLKNNPQGVFSLLDTNLNLSNFNINLVKQTAFHLSSIFSFKNTIKVLNKYPINRSIPLILATIYVVIKQRFKN